MVWCGGGVENVEWGVDDGDGWRLLCVGSNVGVGNEPSDGALGVVYGGDCSGGVYVGVPVAVGVGWSCYGRGVVGCTWQVPFVSVFVMSPLHMFDHRCAGG